MRRRKWKTDELANLAANLGHEDGCDPKEFHSKPWNAPKKTSRKGLQLCEQVKDSLSVILQSCADTTLREVSIIRVEPAPNTGRLLVLVSASEDVNRATIVDALTRASGFLRHEMASAIHRRQAPELIFEVFGA
jgi:ribosome-binding factor A